MVISPFFPAKTLALREPAAKGGFLPSIDRLILRHAQDEEQHSTLTLSVSKGEGLPTVS
jgi:hypothetical protein